MLPLAPSRSKSVRSDPPGLFASPPSLERATVYLVEDDPSLRVLASTLLHHAGFSVRSYETAEGFLAADHSAHPSCLLLDFGLPGINGLDLQAELVRAGSPLPIVFLTGQGTVAMCTQALKAGAVDFLEKPFCREVLIAAVEQAIVLDRRAAAGEAESAVVSEHLRALTSREREVLRLVVAGLANKEVAARLGIAEKTVKVHRGRVMAKLEARSLPDLVRIAARAGIGPEVFPPP